MNRRDTLAALAALGAAAGPFGVAAQQPGNMRRLGILMGQSENDQEVQARLAAFKERLQALGWVEGRNLKIEIRWAVADVNRASQFAKELVALKPDAILAHTTPVTAALQRETRTIPIVFAVVSDPVGSGFIASLPRPGGNITGFVNIESSLVTKFVQLLKEVAPRVSRVAVMFNPQTAPYAANYMQLLNEAAPKLGVTAFAATVSSESGIEEAIKKLGAAPGGGLLLMPDSYINVHRKSVIASAARYKVPAIYYLTSMTAEGGLISYGVNQTDLFRRAAYHVDRILRGAKPADLPVEQPTLYEMAVNTKTASALGLKIPQAILISADTVIQ
ncbi:MAG: ABC transporter substrate-binding protein [Betaproteobacteria bacterium]|nr:ABC transporter substrate-binding protein [Betaproteobacteria bacterium]